MFRITVDGGDILVEARLSAGEKGIDLVRELLSIVTGSEDAPKVETAPPEVETLNQKAFEDFRAACLRSHKVDAIRAIRAFAGLPLKEAKDFVEQFWTFGGEVTVPRAAAQLMAMVRHAA